MTAKQGQTWDMISYEAYENEFFTQELMMANPHLHGIVIFEGGEQVNIPDIEETEEDAWS